MDQTTDIRDDDEGLQEGFDSVSDDAVGASDEGVSGAGETAGSEAQPAQGAPAAPKPSEAASQTEQDQHVDPYAGLPPQVRELLAVAARVPDMERVLTEVREHNRHLEGQVRAFQSRLDKQAAAAAKTPQAVERITRAQDALREDMPDLTDALEELKGLLPEPLESDDVAAPAAAPQAKAPAAQPQGQPAPAGVDPVAQAHMDALDAVAPTWFEDLNSADAQLWLTTRPELAQTLRVARDAKSVLSVHGEFKKFRAAQSTAQTQAVTRQARMAAAATPQGVSRNPSPAQMTSEEDAMKAGFFDS